MEDPAFIPMLFVFILLLTSACHDCPAIDTGRGFICDGTSAKADIEPGFGMPVISAALGNRLFAS